MVKDNSSQATSGVFYTTGSFFDTLGIHRYLDASHFLRKQRVSRLEETCHTWNSSKELLLIYLKGKNINVMSGLDVESATN